MFFEIQLGRDEIRAKMRGKESKKKKEKRRKNIRVECTPR